MYIRQVLADTEDDLCTPKKHALSGLLQLLFELASGGLTIIQDFMKSATADSARGFKYAEHLVRSTGALGSLTTQRHQPQATQNSRVSCGEQHAG